jgi:hypothetical protein
MDKKAITVLNAKYKGTGATSPGFGREFHLTSERNQTDIEAEKEDKKPASKPVELKSQVSLLTDILDQARRGSTEAITKDNIEKLDTSNVTSEKTAYVRDILVLFSKEQEALAERDRRLWEQRHYSNIPIDVNGQPNVNGEPVYYRPHEVFPIQIAGVPYPVSDIVYACNHCTRHKECERHCKTYFIKTDISLCKDSHARMSVSWDITDPENRKGSWRFSVDDCFDRFDYPKDEADLHERALKEKRNTQEEKRDITLGGQGCQPIEPKWRIRELARRIIADYNDDQKNKARRTNLDRKGREYYTKPRHWGGKDPFTPSPLTMTRAAHEFAFEDGGGRVERELRVLLAAWYRGMSREDVDKYDRTSINAREIWAEKMVDMKFAKDEEAKKIARAGIRYEMTKKTKDKVIDSAPASLKKPTRRKVVFEESDEDFSDKEDIIPQPKPPRLKAVLSKLTVEERKLLKQMKDAAAVEATKNAETEARISTAKAEAEAADTLEQAMFEAFANPESSSEDEQPAPKPTVKPVKKAGDKTTKPKSTLKAEPGKRKTLVIPCDDESSSEDDKPFTKSTATPTKKISDRTTKPMSTTKVEPKKRKVGTQDASGIDQPAPKKSRKSYKSSAIIEDSDEEANYQLPNAPTPLLDQQRVGWGTESLAIEVKESIKVVQTDKVEVKEAEIVVEQGTTIVKVVEKKRKHETPEVDSSEPAVKKTKSFSEVESEVAIEDAPTPPYHDLLSPPQSEPAINTSTTPPPSSPTQRRRRESLVYGSSYCSTSSSASDSNKGKKVSFPPNSVSPVLKPRLKSLLYHEDLEGDMPEKKVLFESGVVSPVQKKRKMSIPYVLEGREDGVMMVEEKEDEVAEEGEMDDEDADALFEG